MASNEEGKGRRERDASARADRTARRKRSIFFTNEESVILVDKVIQYSNWILGTAAKKSSKGKKSELWARITDAVNSVGGYDRPLNGVKKRYFDIKRQVRRKMVKASMTSTVASGGPAEEADLTEYEKTLLEFLGRDSFQSIEEIVDSDVLAAAPQSQAPPQSPKTPESDPLHDPMLMERFTSLVSDVISLIEEDSWSSNQESETAMSPDSTVSSSNNEEDIITLTVSDPSDEDTEAAASEAAYKAAPSSTLGNVISPLSGIAEEIPQRAIPPTEGADREQEPFRQNLQREESIASLIVEMNEKLERTHELMRQNIEETRTFNREFLETIQIIGAGLLGSAPDCLFPLWHVRHPQPYELSEDDD